MGVNYFGVPLAYGWVNHLLSIKEHLLEFSNMTKLTFLQALQLKCAMPTLG